MTHQKSCCLGQGGARLSAAPEELQKQLWPLCWWRSGHCWKQVSWLDWAENMSAWSRQPQLHPRTTYGSTSHPGHVVEDFYERRFYEKRGDDRLSSFSFLRRDTEPNLSDSPMCFEASWGKDQYLLGQGKRRAASGHAPAIYSSAAGLKQVIPPLSSVAMGELIWGFDMAPVCWRRKCAT